MSLSQRFAPSAIQSLVKVLSDASAPHSAKMSAAATLLKFGRESIELDDLAGRVEDLERATAHQPVPARGPAQYAGEGGRCQALIRRAVRPLPQRRVMQHSNSVV